MTGNELLFWKQETVFLLFFVALLEWSPATGELPTVLQEESVFVVQVDSDDLLSGTSVIPGHRCATWGAFMNHRVQSHCCPRPYILCPSSLAEFPPCYYSTVTPLCCSDGQTTDTDWHTIQKKKKHRLQLRTLLALDIKEKRLTQLLQPPNMRASTQGFIRNTVSFICTFQTDHYASIIFHLCIATPFMSSI